MRNVRFSTVFAAALMIAAPLLVHADDNWNQNHPRRAQVNHRLQRQNQRIRQERREGAISPAQAQQMHHEDHQIRREERQMARHQHGTISPQQQAQLNQQENAVSQQIGH